MGMEIERKFLIRNEKWRDDADVGRLYVQGYLSTDPDRTVRVRRVGSEAWLTIKGRGSVTRLEFEYPIPVEDATALLALCLRPPLEKRRHLARVGQHVFEVDEFLGAHAGLVIAEVELSSENEDFQRPDWLGEEVSGDHRYTNAWLSEH